MATTTTTTTAGAWNYSLDYTRQDTTTGGMSGGRDTLAATLADLRKSYWYYRDLGYIVRVEYCREICPVCKGAGDLRQGRQRLTNKPKPCKHCKARGHCAELPAEAFALLEPRDIARENAA